MSNEFVPHDSEMNELETALGALVPANSQIDRDRVMFLAGEASFRRLVVQRRWWMAIAASLGVVALGEAGVLAFRPPVRIVEKVVVRENPVAPTPVQVVAPRTETPPPARVDFALSLDRTAYERLAGQVLRYGLDGLPTSPVPRASDVDSMPAHVSRLQLLHDELRNALQDGDAL